MNCSIKQLQIQWSENMIDGLALEKILSKQFLSALENNVTIFLRSVLNVLSPFTPGPLQSFTPLILPSAGSSLNHLIHAL